jgi:ubiquinone/menaquinone biosynthesis C-methylase UbiE
LADERKSLETKSPWWGEHLHRYYTVIPYLKGDEKILDLACGNGFGSDILAQNIEQMRNPDVGGTEGVVIGGDISSEAINESRHYWQRPNLSFEKLDGTQLPYADNYFDIVVSFETIEHTTAYQKMLQEFNRVLKPSGTVFISTPNFPINSPTGKVTNPYHTQEFKYDELSAILKNNFSHVQIFGQQYKRYNIKDLRHRIGYIAEKILLQRGIRKMPIALQDSIMNTLIGKRIYPEASDFNMVEDMPSILKCQTFFALCKKATA